MAQSDSFAMSRRIQATIILFTAGGFVSHIIYSLPNCYDYLQEYPDPTTYSGDENTRCLNYLFVNHKKPTRDEVAPLDMKSNSYKVSELDQFRRTDNKTLYKWCPYKHRLESTKNCTCVYDEQLNDTRVFSSLETYLANANSSQFINNVLINNECYYEVNITNRKYNIEGNMEYLLKESYIVHCDYFCADFILGSDRLIFWACNGVLNPPVPNIHRSAKRSIEPNVYALWDKLKTYVIVFCSIMSLLGNVLTIVVYLKLPELKRTMQGKLIINYLVSTALFNLFPNAEAVTFQYLRPELQWVQTVIMYLGDFFSISWHTWMAVMSYDMWYNFSRPLLKTNSSGLKRFLVYFVVAWGWSAVQSALFIVPQIYGVIVQCDFLYKNGLIDVIITFVTFLFTLFNLKFHHSSKFGSKESRRHGAQQERLFIYLRLAILMGYDWSMLIVSHYLQVLAAYYVFLVLLQSQGIILFVILVCNKRVLGLLRAR